MYTLKRLNDSNWSVQPFIKIIFPQPSRTEICCVYFLGVIVLKSCCDVMRARLRLLLFHGLNTRNSVSYYVQVKQTARRKNDITSSRSTASSRRRIDTILYRNAWINLYRNKKKKAGQDMGRPKNVSTGKNSDYNTFGCVQSVK